MNEILPDADEFLVYRDEPSPPAAENHSTPGRGANQQAGLPGGDLTAAHGLGGSAVQQGEGVPPQRKPLGDRTEEYWGGYYKPLIEAEEAAAMKSPLRAPSPSLRPGPSRAPTVSPTKHTPQSVPPEVRALPPMSLLGLPPRSPLPHKPSTLTPQQLFPTVPHTSNTPLNMPHTSSTTAAPTFPHTSSNTAAPSFPHTSPALSLLPLGSLPQSSLPFAPQPLNAQQAEDAEMGEGGAASVAQFPGATATHNTAQFPGATATHNTALVPLGLSQQQHHQHYQQPQQPLPKQQSPSSQGLAALLQQQQQQQQSKKRGSSPGPESSNKVKRGLMFP